MPTETVTVTKVSEWPDPESRPFSVFVVKTSGPTVTTTNALKASLCQQAEKQHRAIRIVWRDFRRDQKDLVTVDLLPEYAVALAGLYTAVRFRLDHTAKTATEVSRFPSEARHGSQGVHAELDANGLRLMGYPFNTTVVYRIVDAQTGAA